MLSEATARIHSTLCLHVLCAAHSWDLTNVVSRLGGAVVQVKHRVPIGLLSDLGLHIAYMGGMPSNRSAQAGAVLVINWSPAQAQCAFESWGKPHVQSKCLSQSICATADFCHRCLKFLGMVAFFCCRLDSRVRMIHPILKIEHLAKPCHVQSELYHLRLMSIQCSLHLGLLWVSEN